MKLYAPPEYWRLKREEPEELALLVGGCGPGRFGDWLVPDNLLGLDIKPACEIHDFDFSPATPATIEYLNKSNRGFLNNMLRIVNSRKNDRAIKWLRKKLAYYYYNKVVKYGAPAFWDNKNKDEEYREVIV